MMKQGFAKTWRGMLVVTVAGATLLSGCSSFKSGYNSMFGNEDYKKDQDYDPGVMRRPGGNPDGRGPQSMNMDGGMKRPANNPGGAIGVEPVMVSHHNSAPAAEPVAMAAPKTAKKDDSFFSFLFNDPKEEVVVMERRVPQGNHDKNALPVDDMQMASFEAAVPVDEVAMAPLADMDSDYPDLSDVPEASGEMHFGSKKDAMMADLTSARDDMQMQQGEMEAQVMADFGSPVPVTSEPMAEGDLEAEFAALVAAPVVEAPAMEAPAEPQMTAGVAYEDFEPVQPQIMGTPPQTMDQQMASISGQQILPQAAPQEEWVEVEGEFVNQAVPVEMVAVAEPGQMAAVSDVPVVPEWDAGVALTPPTSAAIRTLPESRYAGRRQARNAERYARHRYINGY